MSYDPKKLYSDIQALTSEYAFVECFSAGKSVMQKDIHCLRLGCGAKKLLLSGAYHGLEYLTSAFLMRFASRYAAAYASDADLFGTSAARLFNAVTLYIIPMVNPDGVDIAVNGLDITNPYHRRLISLVGIHSFNSVWQANVRGVDLNHNYDAHWDIAVECPGPTRYGGDAPESEPETRAVVELVRQIRPDMMLAFHSQGREIYYDFDGMTARRSREIAEKMSAKSGYRVCRPTGSAAFGGCKDWFIKEFGKEGFTIEIGSGKNPLPLEMLDEIYDENAKMVVCAMSEMLA